MKHYKDPVTGQVYAYEADGTQDDFIPANLVAITVEEAAILTQSPAEPVTVVSLCAQLDAVADSARHQVAGDPLRAVEYERAATEAQAFAAAGYPEGEVPRTVAAWAINGRSARQAADSILAEATAFTEALYQIRETRLQAKELVRQAMAEGNPEQAQDIAAEAIAAIEAAVAGIGNAPAR
jgi:hypothetical protein